VICGHLRAGCLALALSVGGRDPPAARRQLRVLQPAQPQIPAAAPSSRVHEYPDGRLAIFDGPRCLVRFDPKGRGRDLTSGAA
jgi:hypothetical protein